MRIAGSSDRVAMLEEGDGDPRVAQSDEQIVERVPRRPAPTEPEAYSAMSRSTGTVARAAERTTGARTGRCGSSRPSAYPAQQQRIVSAGERRSPARRTSGSDVSTRSRTAGSIVRSRWAMTSWSASRISACCESSVQRSRHESTATRRRATRRRRSVRGCCRRRPRGDPSVVALGVIQDVWAGEVTEDDRRLGPLEALLRSRARESLCGHGRAARTIAASGCSDACGDRREVRTPAADERRRRAGRRMRGRQRCRRPRRR